MTGGPEGTVVFDGLVEGRVPSDPESEKRIREWTSFASKFGLSFHLEMEGDSFSLLASKAPVPTKTLGAVPAERVTLALAQLLKALPAADRGEVFSTLRSVETRPGQEVQTVYVIGADGKVEAKERVVEAVTAPPEEPVTTRDRVKIGLVGLAVVVAVFGITSFFVDWKGVLTGLWHQVAPLAEEKVAVDASSFSDWLTVESKRVEGDSRVVVVKLRRTAKFPGAPEAAAEGPPADVGKRLAWEAVVRGWLRAEVFDEKGGYVTYDDVRVTPLRFAETTEVKVVVPRDPRPARIVFVP